MKKDSLENLVKKIDSFTHELDTAIELRGPDKQSITFDITQWSDGDFYTTITYQKILPDGKTLTADVYIEDDVCFCEFAVCPSDGGTYKPCDPIEIDTQSPEWVVVRSGLCSSIATLCALINDYEERLKKATKLLKYSKD